MTAIVRIRNSLSGRLTRTIVEAIEHDAIIVCASESTRAAVESHPLTTAARAMGLRVRAMLVRNPADRAERRISGLSAGRYIVDDFAAPRNEQSAPELPIWRRHDPGARSSSSRP